MHHPCLSVVHLGLMFETCDSFKVRTCISNYSPPRPQGNQCTSSDAGGRCQVASFLQPVKIRPAESYISSEILHVTAGHSLIHRTPHAVVSTADGVNLSPSIPPVSLSLSFSDGDEEKDFDIQRNTGTISIARRLDAARHSNYNLTVRVTDGHHSATTQVNERTTRASFWSHHEPLVGL